MNLINFDIKTFFLFLFHDLLCEVNNLSSHILSVGFTYLFSFFNISTMKHWPCFESVKFWHKNFFPFFIQWYLGVVNYLAYFCIFSLGFTIFFFLSFIFQIWNIDYVLNLWNFGKNTLNLFLCSLFNLFSYLKKYILSVGLI